MSSEAKCPFNHASNGGTSNRDWWPIRSKLGMQAKEMPRILKQGLAAKRLTSKGQKRATKYFAK